MAAERSGEMWWKRGGKKGQRIVGKPQIKDGWRGERGRRLEKRRKISGNEYLLIFKLGKGPKT